MRQSNGEASYVERVDSLVINHSRESLFASGSPFLCLNQWQLDSRQEPRFAITAGRSRHGRETTSGPQALRIPAGRTNLVDTRVTFCPGTVEHGQRRGRPLDEGMLRGIQPRGFEAQSGPVVQLHGLVNTSGALDCSFAVEIRGQTDAQLIIDIN